MSLCWLICCRLGGSQIVKIQFSGVASICGFPGVPAVIYELLTLCSRTVDPISSEGSLPVRRSRPSLSGPMNAIFAALLVAMSAERIRHCIFMS